MALHFGALIACSSLQDMDDGAYHEEDEQAEQFRLKVQDIVAVEWATSHSLGLGTNDYTPALVMHVIKATAGDGNMQRGDVAICSSSMSAKCTSSGLHDFCYGSMSHTRLLSV